MEGEITDRPTEIAPKNERLHIGPAMFGEGKNTFYAGEVALASLCVWAFVADRLHYEPPQWLAGIFLLATIVGAFIAGIALILTLTPFFVLVGAFLDWLEKRRNPSV